MPVDPFPAVTPKQLEVVALYASGYNIEEIARKKFLSFYTVRNHLDRARKSVGANHLGQLTAILVEAGLLQRNGVGYVPVQDERVVGE